MESSARMGEKRNTSERRSDSSPREFKDSCQGGLDQSGAQKGSVLLNPEVMKDVVAKIKESKGQQSNTDTTFMLVNSDPSRKDRRYESILHPNHPDGTLGAWPTLGLCMTSSRDRSYVVLGEWEEIRRNRRDIRPVQEQLTITPNHNQSAGSQTNHDNWNTGRVVSVATPVTTLCPQSYANKSKAAAKEFLPIPSAPNSSAQTQDHLTNFPVLSRAPSTGNLQRGELKGKMIKAKDRDHIPRKEEALLQPHPGRYGLMIREEISDEESSGSSTDSSASGDFTGSSDGSSSVSSNENNGEDQPASTSETMDIPFEDPRTSGTEGKLILWPAANKESEWHQFDVDVDSALEVTAKGDVDQRLRTMSSFIISIASNRFGIKEQHATKTATTAPVLNRRQAKMAQLRQELRTLRSRYKKAGEQEKGALAELRGVVRERLSTLRRAEWHRRRGRERARKCSAFIANPFGFTKKLLGEKRSMSQGGNKPLPQFHLQ
ncbi:hypothetical protein NFI96_020515 [Prochilodus magdalenae]|nr:hypothetical protein NFI96_020515 [Prochilodus magdalenae]